MKNELTTMDMSQEDFGNAMIYEAQQRKQKQRLDKSVQIVEVLLTDIENCDNNLLWFQRMKQNREAKLLAIKQGKFSFNKFGAIEYEQKDLNENNVSRSNGFVDPESLT